MKVNRPFKRPRRRSSLGSRIDDAIRLVMVYLYIALLAVYRYIKKVITVRKLRYSVLRVLGTVSLIIGLTIWLPETELVQKASLVSIERNLVIPWSWNERDIVDAEEYVMRTYIGSTGHCTAFQISGGVHGYTVTNEHCCMRHEVGDEMWVGFVPETVLYKHKYADVCLLTNHRNEGLALANRSPRVGDYIMSLGFPEGRTYERGYGRIEDTRSSFRLYGTGYHVGVKTTGTSAPGGSGSPVFNPKMEVVGIIFVYNVLTKQYTFVDVAYIRHAMEIARQIQLEIRESKEKKIPKVELFDIQDTALPENGSKNLEHPIKL